MWRSEDALQFGLDPARAVVVDGVDAPLARLLLDLDGTRTESEVLAAASTQGLDAGAVRDLFMQLRAGGVLADVGGGGAAGLAAEPVPRTGSAAAVRAFGAPAAAGRLGPDLASLALLGGPGGPLEVIRRRRRSTVVVHGAGRVGVSLAALLAAAGVGRVHLADRGPVRPGDVAPGGFTAADVDRTRATAAAEAVRAGPRPRCRPVPHRRDAGRMWSC